MTYTALQLINRSYNLSQIVSTQLQTVTGYQETEGLFLLNELLGFKGSDLRLIPYFQRYTFSTIAGTEEYYIPDLLFVDSMTFNIGVVRYSMRETTRDEYFAAPRVDNIQSLPYIYRIERELGGSRIYMYFEPSEVFDVKLSGKFGLASVMLTTDLLLTYDSYYLTYLRYALSEYLCAEYAVPMPEIAARQLTVMEKKLLDTSPADLSIRKRSYFGTHSALDWQQVNIGLGWTSY